MEWGMIRQPVDLLREATQGLLRAQETYDSHPRGAGCGVEAAKTVQERFLGVRAARNIAVSQFAVVALAVHGLLDNANQ